MIQGYSRRALMKRKHTVRRGGWSQVWAQRLGN